MQLQIIKDHPAASALLAETQARLGSQRRFLIDHDIVSVPSQILPQVRETPPFLRAASLASMDTPGPFEGSTEAYYYITLPEPTQSAAYNRPLIDVVSIHEAFPGHYVQYLWLPRLTRARQGAGGSTPRTRRATAPSFDTSPDAPRCANGCTYVPVG